MAINRLVTHNLLQINQVRFSKGYTQRHQASQAIAECSRVDQSRLFLVLVLMIHATVAWSWRCMYDRRAYDHCIMLQPVSITA